MTTTKTPTQQRPNPMRPLRPADTCAKAWRVECPISGARAAGRNITETGADCAKTRRAAGAVTRENPRRQSAPITLE
jgi:hypothetical protein